MSTKMIRTVAATAIALPLLFAVAPAASAATTLTPAVSANTASPVGSVSLCFPLGSVVFCI
ncbi:hypothetical protein [Nocardia macrotermitis]|uniref:Uncharacterized protein n=1 Tax=Nocardia macrotermitis TaxID=2585198 RepID=A0A7K0CWZ0_9NOCA|nr:hypothetical protein [Nocardia macrotermitis]MQY17923.1 hypothetical protein [Nocardia macrotermitis]